MLTSLKLIDNHYSIEQSNDDIIQLLSLFLLSDVGCSKDNDIPFVSWLENPDPIIDHDASNYAFLEREGNLITIGCRYDEDPYERAIEIDRLKLSKIIREWNKLCNLKPKEIIITKENDNFQISVRN